MGSSSSTPLFFILSTYCCCFDQDAEHGSPELACSFSSDPQESRRQCVTAAIMARADGSLLRSFQRLFQESLAARRLDSSDGGEEEDPNTRELQCFQNLRVLGWIRPQGLLEDALGAALFETILKWVRSTIAGDFESPGLFDQVHEYQTAVVVPWLLDLVGPERLEQDDWTLKVDFTCAECYCLIRNEEIFELVADYPDSHPAVMELKHVLEQTKMYSALGQALKQSLIRRLNHPGAGTNQIIDVYINTIKVLREIDPSDRLLQVVAEPVRSYLRRRHNTVRCIITSLTDAEVGGELYEELRRQDARPLEHGNADSDDEEEEPTFDWQPPPPISKQKGGFFDLVNMGGKAGSNGGDILSILVSIYGSKELFVDEYRLMLADKLLANLDFDTDKEVHTLELLKLRFGELSMRNCEIMIKDTDDSKRVINNIHKTLNAEASRQQQQAMETESPDPEVVDAAIVSHIFWPALQNEQFKHHPCLQAGLDQFGAEYARLKNPRRLVWMNQLGLVQLELDVLEDQEDGTTITETREFSVPPLLATLISHFEDKDEWTAEELSNETGLPEHIIQKRMRYWVGHRVLQLQSPSTYVVATQEHLMAPDDGHHSMPMDEDGHHTQAVSVAAQEEEDLAIYESYICGMLNTHGQLPLDRIHNTLKMFVTGSDIKYNKTPQQLNRLLQHLCKQDKLECGPDGMYKLVKK
jgi:anaphase-promoting complex subunit 2